jgi:hypothetical protein
MCLKDAVSPLLKRWNSLIKQGYLCSVNGACLKGGGMIGN